MGKYDQKEGFSQDYLIDTFVGMLWYSCGWLLYSV